MKIGICVTPDQVAFWPDFPGAFAEVNVQGQLVPELDDAAFAPQASAVRALPVPALAANCFLPGDLKVVGPEADANRERLLRYADNAFRRAAGLGIVHIVFGSGGARKAPVGWPLGRAFLQYVEALRLCAPLAEKYGVVLLVEPLNRSDCNVVNTVLEGVAAVAQVDHPAVRLLADIFHMLRNGESPDDLVKAGPWLNHVHVAEAGARTAPGMAGDDFTPFFHSLREARYAGDLSVECLWGKEPYAEAVGAFDVLERQLGLANLMRPIEKHAPVSGHFTR